LAILVKRKIVPLNLWWKLSPLVWMVLLLVVFFMPMQWGAPAGPVNVYQAVVEIIPNVSGEIVEVPVKPRVPVKQGEVLFTIDPTPFQAEVTRLEAALAEAKQNVPQLKATLDAAASMVDQAEAQRDLAKLNFARAESLRAQPQAGAISELEFDQARQSLVAAEAAVRVAAANQEQARLAYASEINGENTTVAQLQAQLAAAKLNLSWTVERAPADGYVVSVSLRPGQRVTAMPFRGWLAFVETGRRQVAVGIDQYALRHVQPGQPAEVVFKLFPGKTFAATVDSVAYMAPEGQVQASGVIPTAPTRNQPTTSFGVILAFDEENEQIEKLPGGAVGSAAIYTDNAKPTHIIRRVMLRMESWLNYLLPW
jgi:multidrug resistance efflux pump